MKAAHAGLRVAGLAAIFIFLSAILTLISKDLQAIRDVRRVTSTPPPAALIESPASTSTETVSSSTTQVVETEDQPVREVPPGMICGAQNIICVNASFASTTFGNPVVVTGTAMTDEKSIFVALEGNLVAGVGTYVRDSIQLEDASTSHPWKNFTLRLFNVLEESVEVAFSPTSTGFTGAGPRSVGFEAHVKQVPLRKIKLFFAATPDASCTRVTPKFFSIPWTDYPAEAALHLLMEKSGGSAGGETFTQGTEIMSFRVGRGTATVVFSKEYDWGEGACAAERLKAEIVSTLKQFPMIKEVKIEVQK